MISTYLKSKDKAQLDALRGFVVNMVGPMCGRGPVPETVTAEGVTLPAEPAKGNPEYYYACVLAPFPITPYGDIEACDTQEGIDVCGVWS